MGLLLTKSFKTASTESIILLSNITPIDHVIIRNAACRLLSNRDDPFTPSSYHFLNNSLPELAIIEKSDKSESPFSGSLPPWDFGFNISFLPKHIVVPLLPSDENTVHIFSVNTQSSGLTVSGIVVTNHTGLISSHNFSFKTNKTKYNSRLAFQKVISIALSLSHTESIIDIFLQSSKDINFIKPSVKHNTLDSDNFNILTSIRGRINFYFGLHEHMAGYEFAREASGKSSPPEIVKFPPSKADNKGDIESLLFSIWDREWSSSQKGETTRNFFPNVKAARILMTKRPSNKITQILTGHCVLNAHQHRFGFIEDPSCSCGEPLESLHHFLFFCPTYNVIRKVFRDISLEVYNIWPPELSMIPRSETLWRAMKSFVFNSKRIDTYSRLRK